MCRHNYLCAEALSLGALSFLSNNTIQVTDLKTNFLFCLEAALTMPACGLLMRNVDMFCKKLVKPNLVFWWWLCRWMSIFYVDLILLWNSKSVCWRVLNWGQPSDVSGFSFSVLLLNILCFFLHRPCSVHFITLFQ